MLKNVNCKTFTIGQGYLSKKILLIYLLYIFFPITKVKK